jgi:hypothetical protein
MGIPIQKIKQWREEIKATHIVVFAIDDSKLYVATHGENPKQAKEAAVMGNNLKKELGWEPNLCKEEPLQRTCSNCTYYKPEKCSYYTEGNAGNCQLEPIIVKKQHDDKCRHFEPNC